MSDQAPENPFARFAPKPDAQRALPARPSDEARFEANMEAGLRYSPLGALGRWITAGVSPEFAADVERAYMKAEADYQAFPEREGLWEGVVALGGQLAGGAPDPSNFVGGPVGRGGVKAAEPILGALWARVFGGAVDATIMNVATDVAAQGLDISTGLRSGIDPVQAALSGVIGAPFGGAAGAIGHAISPWKDAPDDVPIGPAFDTRPQDRGQPVDDGQPQGPGAPDGGPATVTPVRPEDTAAPASEPFGMSGEFTIDGDAPAAAAAAPKVDAPGVSTSTPSPTAAAAAPPVVAETVRVSRAAAADPERIADAGAAEAAPPTPGRPAGVFQFDAAALELDPTTFQFKADGDAEGVTQKLRYVTKWDPAQANQLIVWQAADGKNFVVDGHQRTGLARRLAGESGEAIKIPGLLFRESDGFSADDVMVIAAKKNIGEGSASPLDAAKIMRARPDVVGELQGISDYRIRQAADIARLDEDAWRMTVNEIVTPEQAAIVGRMIPEDGARQAAAIEAIKRLDPANAEEAQILVRKVVAADMAKAEEGAQGSLFGDDPASSTIHEEIKIVAAALKAVRGDRALMARVSNAAGEIESKLGAEIDTARAGKIRDEAGVVAAYIQSQADTAGPIRTALLTAAGEVKNGKRSVAEAARGLVEDVRAALGRDDADRPGTGRPAEGADGTAPGGRAGDDGDQPDFLGRSEGGSASGAIARGDADLDGGALAKSVGHRGAPSRADAGRASTDPVVTRELTRLHELGGRLEELLDLPAVRQGRLSVRAPKGGKVLGQYSPKTGVVRVRSIDDFDTLTHEAGHHLEMKIGRPVQALMNAHAAELKPMAYPGAPARVRLKEGFAEYIRLALTNPAYAARHAPAFDAAFRALLARTQPDIAKVFADIPPAYASWIAQPSRAAVASTVVSAKRPSLVARTRSAFGKGFGGFAGTIADGFNTAYGWFVADLNGLERGVRALARIYKENTGALLDLNASDDAHKLARMARGAGASAQNALLYGPRGYRSLDIVAPGLRDAIVEATGATNALFRWDDDKVQLFGAYLASRRVIGEWDRFARGLIPNQPDKLTRGDHETAVAEWEAEFPAFANAAAKVHDFARAIWTIKFDAGLITAEQYRDGLAIADYVPLQRHFDADEAPATKAGGRDGKGDIVKRFKGSTRDIVNPLDSLIADTHQTAGMIARNDAVRALADLAQRAGNGAGRIAERIPVHELRASIVDPIEAAENAARAAGLGTADTVMLRDMMVDMLGDTEARIFRPAVINEKGEPIVFYREGGELRALRLADGELGRDMLAAFNQMTRSEADLLTRILAVPATLLRAGITTSLEFLGANLIRDTAQSVLMYGKPFARLGATLAGGKEELMQGLAVRHYNAAGGIMGGANTANLADVFVTRDLQGLRKRGWATQRLTSFKGVLQATELTETANRVGLFSTFRREAEARGLSGWEAVFEAAWRARDYIDFDRRGSQMAVLARIIPFLNASLQGIDKWTRHTVTPLFRKAATTEDARDRALAARTWAYTAMALVPATTLYALQGKDWKHEEISDTTRASHWMIKWGETWLAVPKPFEFALVFNAAEAAWDATVRGEPDQARRFLEDAWSVTAPPSLMTGNPAIALPFELATGTDIFSGNPIVPESVQGLEPSLQWTAKTSEISKWLGANFGVSPAVADHMLTSIFGSWGANALALGDWATGTKGTQSWDDFAVTRRFLKDEARGSRSIGAFYDRVARSNGSMSMAAATYKTLAAGDPRAASDFLAQQDAPTRAYVTAAMHEQTEVRRAHPMFRARDAVSQINALRRAIAGGTVETADGKAQLSDLERGVADDILADLAMVEARNALILTDARGWAGKAAVDPDGYITELRRAAPKAAEALADRYATAKVRKFEAVRAQWAELSARLLREGTAAEVLDLTAPVKAEGTELNGTKLPKANRPAVEGLGEDVPLP